MDMLIKYVACSSLLNKWSLTKQFKLLYSVDFLSQLIDYFYNIYSLVLALGQLKIGEESKETKLNILQFSDVYLQLHLQSCLILIISFLYPLIIISTFPF